MCTSVRKISVTPTEDRFLPNSLELDPPNIKFGSWHKTTRACNMLKLKENPPIRWPEKRSLSEDCGKWWLIYTKPRNEKAFAWELLQSNISYYLPMIIKRSPRSDGKSRKSMICLFPSYISIVDYPRFQNILMQSNRIASVIHITDQDRFVKDLEQVHRIIENPLSDIQVHNETVVGKKAIIMAGPLKGCEGIIMNIANNNRLFINVEMFNRSISINVDPSFLKPVH